LILQINGLKTQLQYFSNTELASNPRSRHWSVKLANLETVHSYRREYPNSQVLYNGSLDLVVQIHGQEWRSANSWDEDEDMPSPELKFSFVVTVVVGSCIDFLDHVRHKFFGPTHWTIYGIMLRKVGSSQELFVRVG
jgi:hypothetical protein